MLDRLSLLVELQQIDKEILTIKQNLSRLPVEAKRRSVKLDEKKARLESLTSNHKSLQVDNKELELEISALEASILRFQAKILELKSQRDYQAMKTQIASHKADLKRTEDQSLKLMQQLDTLKEQIDKLAEEVGKETEDINGMLKQSEQEKEAARGRVLELKDERNKLVRKIDPQDYEMYRRLMRPPNFIAVSAVSDTGLCTACNVQIEPQLLNRLYIGRDLVFCSNCARLLFLKSKISGE